MKKKVTSRIMSVIISFALILSLSACDKVKVSENIRDDDDIETTTETTTETTEEVTTEDTASTTDSVTTASNSGDTTEETSTETTEDSTESSTEDSTESGSDDSSTISGSVVSGESYIPENYENNNTIANGNFTYQTGDLPFIYARKCTSQVESDTYQTLFTLSHDYLYLMPGTEDDYPGIQRALEQFNQIYSVNPESIDEATLDMAREQSESYEESNSSFGGYYEKSTSYVERVDDKVLSIINYSTNYWGGAHGMYGYGGHVYDAVKGNELEITDVVTNLDTLEQAALQVFEREYYSISANEPNSSDNLSKSFDDLEYLNWSLGPTSLNLYYNPYALASYASGIQILHIRYDEFPDLFKEGYGASEGNWVQRYWNRFDTTIFEDITGDGVTDYIHLNMEEDYSDEYCDIIYNTLHIETANDIMDFDIFAYEPAIYLIKSDSNFYILLTYDGYEERFIDIYDISNGYINHIDCFYGSFSQPCETYNRGDNYYEEPSGIFYDPDFFYLSERTDIAGTCYGAIATRFSPAGNLPYIDDKFMFGYDLVLTSKKDLSVSVIDEGGNVIKGDTIPEGTDYHVIRTDDRTFFDAMLDDGRIVRVIAIATQSPTTIFGEDIEDVFDGVTYAD